MTKFQPGDVWLDSEHKPVLVLALPEIDARSGLAMIDLARLQEGVSTDRWTVSIQKNESNGLKNDVHVELGAVMGLFATRPGSLSARIGSVALAIVETILDTQKEVAAAARLNAEQSRPQVREIRKFDYDIAISFSGADRKWASLIADRLVKRSIRVFYDEYEAAGLWGEDLVQRLDSVYQERARYCLILVSSEYAASMWPNHELKSALARSIRESEPYILPVQLDQTVLPGLPPTVSYLRLDSQQDVEVVVSLAAKKIDEKANLINYAEFSAKWIQNVVQINRLWGIDCLAFCVDRRYLMDHDGGETRIGVSYGVNVTSPRTGLLAPEEQDGKNVLGLHMVSVVDGTRVFLSDKWYDSLPAPTFERLEDAVGFAYEELANIPDEKYQGMVTHADSRGLLHTSARYLLDEFDIVTDWT